MSEIEFVDFAWRDRAISIEHAWINREWRNTPLILFVHDGLGCVSMWRDYPQKLCDAVGCRGLVFSRWGYGHSSGRDGAEQWGADFLQVQATELIPLFLAALDVREPVCLYGQSDGGSIALIMAALQPIPILSVTVTAPHTTLELVTAKGVHEARVAFNQGDLKRGLARHHRDADSVMAGWSGSWLAPEARDWSIVPLLSRMSCPVLAVQGQLDHYGTMEQIRVIARHAPQARLLELPDCGHIPHQDQAELVTRTASTFIRGACLREVPVEEVNWPYAPDGSVLSRRHAA